MFCPKNVANENKFKRTNKNKTNLNNIFKILNKDKGGEKPNGWDRRCEANKEIALNSSLVTF